MGYVIKSWVLFYLIFLGIQTEANGQYSQATQEVLNVPIFFTYRNQTEGLSKEQIYVSDIETTGRNKFKSQFLKGVFHNSIGSDSALIYFTEAMMYGKKIGLGYDTLGLIDYSIAKMNFRANKTKIAELQLDKIIENTLESDYIYWLSKIAKALRHI